MKYRQIEGVIRQRIADGTYTTRIPTAPVLAGEFGVDRQTIHRALRGLKDEGLVFSQKRRGTLLTGRPPDVPSEQMHTVAEVAALAGVATHTVYDHIHSGKLPARRIGRSFRIPATARASTSPATGGARLTDTPGPAAATGHQASSPLIRPPPDDPQPRPSRTPFSAGTCTAGEGYTDRGGNAQVFVASERNGTWDRAISVPGLQALNQGRLGASVNSVSCASPGTCTAGGTYSDSDSNEQGSWPSRTTAPGTARSRYRAWEP